MKLQIFDFGTTKVQCLNCGKWISWGYADLEGPSFKAYYCAEHKTDLLTKNDEEEQEALRG
jgi:hypothetical protein